MSRLSTIELYDNSLCFDAGHFLIYSATKRGRFHGHSYQVYCALTAPLEDAGIGMSFDLHDYSKHMHKLCEQLNGFFLVSGESPYTKIEEENNQIIINFNEEKIAFSKFDVKVIPVVNITIEELSRWFLDRLLENTEDLKRDLIEKIVIKVSDRRGQFGSATWEKS